MWAVILWLFQLVTNDTLSLDYPECIQQNGEDPPPSLDIKIEEKNVKVLDSYNLLFLQMRQVVFIQIWDVELGY